MQNYNFACCFVWVSFTLRDESRLRVLENRLLRRISGHKRDEVTRKSRKLNNEELNVLLTKSIKLRIVRLAWHVACMGERRDVCREFFMGKPEGTRPLGRPRFWWVENIKMHLQKLGCGVMNWTELAQDRDRWRALVNVVMKLRVA